MLRHPSRYVCIPDGASISLSCQMKSFIVFVIFTRHGLEDSAFETSKIYLSQCLLFSTCITECFHRYFYCLAEVKTPFLLHSNTQIH